MKIKLIALVVIVLVAASAGLAQKKTKPAVTPHDIIVNLYKAQEAGKGPFFQYKSRVIIDKYFAKSLADLIWKDAVEAKGEVGRLDFDPLYGSQDPQAKDRNIMDTGWGGDAKFGPANEAVVQVTFKSNGKEQMVSFRFHQEKSKLWKIYDIRYVGEAEDRFLKTILAGE